MRYDAIVVGLGATGGATLYHLAQRDVRVLGLDAFSPPHDKGSSHGQTRIYRQAYYEAPAYVPLALRALELWRALEADTNSTLFIQTGALTIGPERGELFTGALASAVEHGIAHDVLSPAETMRRFPAFVPPPATMALFEPTGGVLFAEACVEAHIGLARARGADVRLDERVNHVRQHGDGTVVVTTSAGRYSAPTVVVAAGAWAPRLLGLEHVFRITRETVHWFASHSPSASASVCPVSMIEYEAGPILYTIPDFGHGFKAGLHHAGLAADPHAPDRPSAEPHSLDARDATHGSAAVAAALERYAPGGAGPLRASVPCYYTTTRDHHFAIGALPDAPGVILASACSGHGFKFAPALGEAIAALVCGNAGRRLLDYSITRLLE